MSCCACLLYILYMWYIAHKTDKVCLHQSTHHLVIVVELQHHFGGVAGQTLRVPVDLQVVEDQGLVPGGVQRGLQLLCGFTQVQEGHVCKRICDGIWNKGEKYFSSPKVLG